MCIEIHGDYFELSVLASDEVELALSDSQEDPKNHTVSVDKNWELLIAFDYLTEIVTVRIPKTQWRPRYDV